MDDMARSPRAHARVTLGPGRKPGEASYTRERLAP